MKRLIFAIALAVSSQGIKINPFTGLPDLVGTGGGGSSVVDGVLLVSASSGTVLSIASGNARQGNTTYPISAATATITAGSGSGSAKVFITSAGATAVEHSTAAGLTITCTSCTASQVTTPAFPVGSIPIADVTIVSGAWGTVTDRRAFLSSKPITAGTGITVTESGGEALVAIDTADVPRLGGTNPWTGSNDVSGATGFIKGYSSLTTAGAVPYVSASGTLNQDQTAGGQFFWDATNHRLGVGTTSPSYSIDTKGLRVFDQTAVTGSTLAVIQAGAGQSGNLLEFKNNAGTNFAVINSQGRYETTSAYYLGSIGSAGDTWSVVNGNTSMRSDNLVSWSSTTVATAAKDSALGRNAAGLIEVNSGTAGTIRDIKFRRWTGTVGGAIASAGTIAPVDSIQHVTGTTTISTITAPANCAVASTTCQIVLIPDGLWATNTAGNIAIATTAVVSKALTLWYDNATSKWYPSY